MSTLNTSLEFMITYVWIVIKNMKVKLLVILKNEFMNTSGIRKKET